jgi:predicted transcriptional regulator
MSAHHPLETALTIPWNTQVAAFISNNPLPKSELPALIHAVHSAVERLGKGPENAPPQVELKTPAVPIRKSVTPDYLICLEDGKSSNRCGVT